MILDIYLENQRLDIDDASSLAITYNFSDLTNPTTQTGDYSTTFTVKGTQHNNAIFGQIWRLDRVTLFGGEFNTYVHFNASKRTNCVIYINHEIFKRGYLKLNTIKSAKGVISYEVTFYSEMVDVLRTLKESKLRDLPFPNDLRHTLNADNIGAFWDKNSGNSEVAPLLPYLAYVMANNGIYDEFESSKWLTLRNGKYEVETMLNEIQLDECAKREYRSYYQRPALRLKGLIDLIAEQHSIQLDPAFFNDSNPYYADSVMALPQYNIMEQENQQTGMSSYGDNPNEDPDGNVGTITINDNGVVSSPIIPWFKGNNIDESIMPAEWENNLNIGAVNKDKVQPILELEFSITANIDASTLVAGHDYLFMAFPDENHVSDGILPTVTAVSSTNKRINLSLMPQSYIADNNYYTYLYDDRKQTTTEWNGDKVRYLSWRGILDMKADKTNGYKTAKSVFSPSRDKYFVSIAVKGSDYEQIYDGYNRYGIEWLPLRFIGEPFEVKPFETLSFEISANTGRNFPKIVRAFYTRAVHESGGQLFDEITVSSYTVYVRPITKAPTTGGNLNEYYPALAGFTGNDIAIAYSQAVRTGYGVDKVDIIDYETTQGDFLINYAKLFGLIFYTDRDGTPHLVTRNTFFKDYKVEDWTQKIDHAKEIQQVPIPFDSKYLLMQYQDGGTHYEDYYRTQYDGEFGGQKINTGFEFNENETDLIPEIMFYNTVMSKERTRMLIGSQYLVDTDPKTLPAMFQREDGGRTPSDTKFNLLFDNGMIDIATSNKYIYLTDDNDQMLNESDEVNGGKICWLDVATVPIQGTTDTLYLPRNQYPQFSTLHKDSVFSWHLGYPLENYAGWMRSDFPESSTIYANFWRNYITEIYDVDNRIMTAYVRLTAADIAQFSFANFVKIGDALWHVNKIEQFDPLGNGTTKVEFLRVSSLAAIENAYKNGQTDMSAIVPPEPETFNVEINLTNIRSTASSTSIEEGKPFETILTTASGYRIGNIVVTMGGQDITAQVFTADADNTSGTISIPAVTDNVTIVGTGVKKQYDVVLQLTHITSSTDDTNVEDGETFTAILDADTGYRIDSIVVTMGNTDITSQTIGGVKVWRPNANNSGGTITIAGVTDEVNIVASAAQASIPYITINVYCDDDRIILQNSQGEQYKYMSKTTPTQVRLYGDESEYGCTLLCNDNLPGAMVLLRGRPVNNNQTIAYLDCIFTPSNYLSIDAIEFNDYSDFMGNGFMGGENYYIMVVQGMTMGGDTSIRGLMSNQNVYSFNGKTAPIKLTSGDGERFTVPKDSLVLQISPCGDREYAEINRVGNYEGYGDGIVVPSEDAWNYGVEMGEY